MLNTDVASNAYVSKSMRLRDCMVYMWHNFIGDDYLPM